MFVEGEHQLHTAAERGDAAQVTALLAAGAYPDGDPFPFGDGHDESPLHAAAAHGHPEIVTALLAAGARVDELDWARVTPLIRGLEQGAHRDEGRSVELLLEAGADVNRVPPRDCFDEPGAALWWLVHGHLRYSHTRLPVPRVLALLDQVVARGASLDQIGPGGQTALHRLAASGRDEDAPVVRWLVERGADLARRDAEGALAIELAMSEAIYDALGGDA